MFDFNSLMLFLFFIHFTLVENLYMMYIGLYK